MPMMAGVDIFSHTLTTMILEREGDKPVRRSFTSALPINIFDFKDLSKSSQGDNFNLK